MMRFIISGSAQLPVFGDSICGIPMTKPDIYM